VHFLPKTKRGGERQLAFWPVGETACPFLPSNAQRCQLLGRSAWRFFWHWVEIVFDLAQKQSWVSVVPLTQQQAEI